MLDAVAGAGPAVVARRPAAVLNDRLSLRRAALPVLPQEVLVEPRGQMVPRQHLPLESTMPVARRRQWSRPSAGQRRGLPPPEVEMLGTTPGRCRRRRHTCSITGPETTIAPDWPSPSASAGRRIVPLELERRLAAAQVASRSTPILRRSSAVGVLTEPLERRVNGLGTKPPTRHGDRRQARGGLLAQRHATLRANSGYAQRVGRRSPWAGR